MLWGAFLVSPRALFGEEGWKCQVGYPCELFLGAVLGPSWAVFGASRPHLSRLGALLELSLAVWCDLGALWDPLWPSWRELGGLWANLVKIHVFRKGMGPLLLLRALLGVLLDASWAVLGGLGDCLRTIFGFLGASWRPLGGLWGAFWGILDALGGLLGVSEGPL